TPVEQLPGKDRKVCPNFLLGIKNNDVFFQLSPINKGAYDFLPNGLPTQKFFFDLKSDSQQNINLYKTNNKSISKLEAKTKAWLKANKEPVVYNKEAYKILVEE
ncbi:MAG TPA: hypothetical protein VFM79_01685, partial [Pelobium sp.]|nr:hypothetical protein [Pelobium sp.]